MKKDKLSLEQLEKIVFLFNEVICELEDNEIEYDEVILHDILREGAFSLAFHLDLDIDDIPFEVMDVCDELRGIVSELFDDIQETEEFVSEFIDKYYL